MAANRKEAKLLEAMWERVEPLIPGHPPQPKGGRPFVSDYECFCGIVYQLRNSIRWNDMPKDYPSGCTCWRRFNFWTELGIWENVHRIILEELQAAGLLDLSELALDATFVEARKGGTASARQNAA
jgi:transposase